MIKYIYVLIDPRDNIIKYVGQTTKNIEIRLKGHISDSKYKKHKNANWIKKLIRLNLKPIITCIDIVSTDDLGFWEMYYIFKYKKMGILLNNHTLGGEGTFGYKHTNDWKRIRSIKYTGVGNPFYNKTHTTYIKKIISSVNRHGINNGMYGKIHTKETKKIMSNKKKNIYIGDKNPRAKTIYQFDSSNIFINSWSTAKECADLYDLSRGNISSTASYNKNADLHNTNINIEIDKLKQYINQDNYSNIVSAIEKYKKQLKKYKTVKGFIFKFNYEFI